MADDQFHLGCPGCWAETMLGEQRLLEALATDIRSP